MKRLLVANRGEIAVRIFRTCERLGIETVAVAAPDDREALHVRSADHVVPVSGYLEVDEHVRAARESAAEAVHPGYGFLAESPELAEAVEHAGLAFVGPPAEALSEQILADVFRISAFRAGHEHQMIIVPWAGV